MLGEPSQLELVAIEARTERINSTYRCLAGACEFTLPFCLPSLLLAEAIFLVLIDIGFSVIVYSDDIEISMRHMI